MLVFCLLQALGLEEGHISTFWLPLSGFVKVSLCWLYLGFTLPQKDIKRLHVGQVRATPSSSPRHRNTCDSKA